MCEGVPVGANFGARLGLADFEKGQSQDRDKGQGPTPEVSFASYHAETNRSCKSVAVTDAQCALSFLNEGASLAIAFPHSLQRIPTHQAFGIRALATALCHSALALTSLQPLKFFVPLFRRLVLSFVYFLTKSETTKHDSDSSPVLNPGFTGSKSSGSSYSPA